MPKLKDLTGSEFGRLKVLNRTDDYVSPSGYRKARWDCICSCGCKVKATSQDLLRGEVMSCGCYAIESRRINATTHGHSSEQLHTVWKGIKARCFNKNHKNYQRYGGRGITMCRDWAVSYECFRKWALDNGYESGLTLDRINNDGNYEPENCRFVTRVAQANNRSNNQMITYSGETHNIKWWSDKTGIPYGTLYHRLKVGWNITDALTKQPK